MKFNKHGIAIIHKEKRDYLVYNGRLTLEELQQHLLTSPGSRIVTNSAVRITY